MLVALVDDDESVRVALGSLLRAHGYDVREFCSAEEFVAASIRPACLVLDNKLPAMSGLDLHRHLEHTNLLTSVVFVTSADDSIAEMEALMRRGVVVAYFRKPFDVTDFLLAIARACA
jgi:FixJ family two-component response regulator